jgi:hypothetical protein
MEGWRIVDAFGGCMDNVYALVVKVEVWVVLWPVAGPRQAC